MMRYAYNKALISGTICAGGSLGTIIPPSVVVVILAPVADVSVGDLFVGMLIPGLLLAALYIVYIIGRCMIWPEDGPRLPPDPSDPGLLEKLYITATAMILPLFLIFAVLNSIGLIPGVGGQIAGLVAYDQSKKLSPERDKFGTGHSEGVIAASKKAPVAPGPLHACSRR